jgi:hypothetical protein
LKEAAGLREGLPIVADHPRKLPGDDREAADKKGSPGALFVRRPVAADRSRQVGRNGEADSGADGDL